ncbi:MAG: lycopene cyclase domain-containing protein [Flavobacteriaceae bacterium]|nr:lycopene cyclase domain-containing protein [Flavobacteriaceae bacterium]
MPTNTNTYFYLLLLCISGPFLLSFDKKVSFYKEWKFFVLSMLPVSVFYLIWDIIFTNLKVWEFNKDFLVGQYFSNIPLEEYGFFIVIPYCCLFIYACLKKYIPVIGFKNYSRYLSIGLILLSISLLALHPKQLYTATTFGLLFLSLCYFTLTHKTQHLTHIYLSWMIALIPMALVNGVLTGKPILIYNDAENMGIRIGTIPIEDFFYNLVYMIWMVYIYEFWKSKQGKSVL